MFPDWELISAWARTAPTELAKYLEGTVLPAAWGLARRVALGEIYAALISRPDEETDTKYDLVWCDQQVAANQAGGASALTLQAYRDTGFEMLFWRRDQTDTLYVTCQLPHEYERGTSVRFHLHVIPMAASGGNAVFDYAYASANVSDELPAVASWTTGQSVTAIAAGDQYKHRPIEVVEIPLPSARESRIVCVRIARNPGSDTYQANADGGGLVSANLALLSLDFHVQRSKWGTIEEFPGAPP